MPAVGTIIDGKYRISALRGDGAMAEIFEVVHVDLGATFALKLAREEIAKDKELARRFENEARAAARIRSDHVARILDVGRFEERPYMVMELLVGEDLEKLSARIGVLPVQEAVDYVVQALAALEQVHAAGIVHRDLKPSNLFLHRTATGTIVKLVDFGVSTSFGTETRITQTGSVLGSPAYMSPEQLRSAKHVDARADLWSIGVILYELLTGTMPFFGENVGAVFAAILEIEPPPPSTRSAGIPAGLDQIILKCLRRKPEERWSSAAELAQVLEPWRGPARASWTSMPPLRASNPKIIETISSVPPSTHTIPPDVSKRSVSAWAESVRIKRTNPARKILTAAGIAALAATVAAVATWKLKTSTPSPAVSIAPSGPPSLTAVVVPPPEPTPAPTPSPAPETTKAKPQALKDAGAPATRDDQRIFGRH